MFTGRLPYHLFFNANSEFLSEKGYILLEENLRFLIHFLEENKKQLGQFDIADLLDVSRLFSTRTIPRKQSLNRLEKFSVLEEEVMFQFIENYF